MSRYILALPFLLFLGGCNPRDDAQGVKGAKGETPVKYVICGAAETNCLIAARFKDLDGCESHKKWSEMLCDSVSQPGKMICETDRGASIAFSYCTL
jgi:hypothetical protein